MKMSEMFPSKYLSKDDVKSPIIASIRGLGQETIKGQNGDELKNIIYFNGSIKNLVLNKGNASILCALYGDDTNNWVGKSIEIYSDPAVMFGGRAVGGIRLRQPQSGHRSANYGDATFTYPQALSECEKHGINKDALVAALKAAGLQGWNDAKCSPVVHQLIAQKQAEQEPSPFDHEFDDAGAGDMPF